LRVRATALDPSIWSQICGLRVLKFYRFYLLHASLVEKYGFRRGLELWNRLLSSNYIVTRQVRLTRFLPEYRHSKEKSIAWGATFHRSSISFITHQKSPRFMLIDWN
jgi:hypothetical protein